MIRAEAFEISQLKDLDALFATDGIADDCWCMWYLMRVADFHAAGRDAKRAAFIEHAGASKAPMGVIAYEGQEPVGWCGVGPRSRYERALKTPTLKGRDPDEDQDVWLVTCFFTRGARPLPGVPRVLLQRAIDLAGSAGANAIEGFPDAIGKTSDRGARGAEALFTELGFRAVRRPSPSRAIMRLDF